MEITDNLNERQLEAVTTINGPLMIIAGPGSGKTCVLSHKIAYLIKMKKPPDQIVALTFTNKAAEEMKKRISHLVSIDSNKILMGTFHSIFARILRTECENIGYKKNFSIYDINESLYLLKNIILSLNLSLQQYNPNTVYRKITQLKSKIILPNDFSNKVESDFEEKISTIYTEYQKNLFKNNAMDFDDLLLKPIELFSKNRGILEKYQERFRYVLIDEYQDTNYVQYVLIKNLVNKYRNICVVGDDAQSIYSFRGADIRNILEFEKDYPNAKIIKLEQNYRSTKTILGAANKVIKYNCNQITKNLWTNNCNGDPITIIECFDDKEEGQQIVNYINYEVKRLKINFRDFAVMYRTNAQSRSLEDALRKANIPYTIVGGIEFYQRKEIKDVLAYLRLIINPKDNVSFLRIVNYPARGIGVKAVNILKNYSKKYKLNLLEAAELSNNIVGIPNKAKVGLSTFCSLIKKYRALSTSITASELTKIFIDEIGILKILREEGTPEALARCENIQELLSAISEHSHNHSTESLESFLQEVSLLSEIDQWDNKHNTVTLMTLHSAKGLEFPVVFIVGLEEGLLPYYNTENNENNLEEERRLCYVGISRAIKKLYLTYTRTRYRFGDITYSIPSRFLAEIKDDSCEIINEKHKKRVPLKHLSENFSSNTFEQIQVGSKVQHPTFGSGIILNISGKGDDTKAVVDFCNIGRKNLMLKYANIKLDKN